jgi:hypothetical protein
MLGMPVVLHTLAVVAGRLVAHMLLVQQLAVDTLVPADILPVLLLVPRTLAARLQVDEGLWLELRAEQLQVVAAGRRQPQEVVAAGRSELLEVAVAACTAVAS